MKNKHMHKKIKAVFITLVVSCFIATATVVGGSMYLADVFGGKRYTDLDEQRRSEMLQLYEIKPTDDAELAEYSTDVGFSDKALLIVNTDDLDSFMKNCLPKDPEMTAENEFHYMTKRRSSVHGKIIENEDGSITVRLTTR